MSELTVRYTNAEYVIDAMVYISANKFGTPIFKAAQLNGEKLTLLLTLLVAILATQMFEKFV